ncbi:MAG: hypothetical protein ACRDOK_19235 [Streptosporangiaceae bacterium]
MKVDDHALAWLQVSQRGVLSRTQALQCGITPNGVQHRLRRRGPWQRLLPGVYLTATGQPTWEQQQIAALLHAGPDGLITGQAALLNYRLLRSVPRVVDVLVPLQRQCTGSGFVRLHRTRRMPTSAFCDGPIRFAPPERAVADTARALADLVAARAVVASAVQRGQCTVAQLAAELRDGPIRGSANLRAVLDEVIAGIRSVPEGDLRRLIIRAALPQPLYNPKLYVGEVFLAQPDAWWPEYGVAVEVDSREWHLSPADWEQTMARHRRMCAAGAIVVHVSPRQLRDQAAQLEADLAAALRAGRPLPAITTRPLAA